jgi:hypothetical protein
VSTNKVAYGTYTALTVTNLQSLANDSSDVFAGWQSDIVDNRSTLALDYDVFVHLPTANTAPANDERAYVYLIPWTHNGSAWRAGGNFGTTTLPSGSEGTANISDPNSMRAALALPYKIAQQILQGAFSVASILGFVPEGWSLAIRNCTGAALSTGCVVSYEAKTTTNT